MKLKDLSEFTEEKEIAYHYKKRKRGKKRKRMKEERKKKDVLSVEDALM